MTRSMAEQLTTAMGDGQLVRLYRPFEEAYVRGYVLDVGAEFFLLSLVSDRLWFDGFECFRVDDVDEVVADPYTRFTEAALSARGEIKPDLTLRLTSIGDLLTSAAERFPLVTIHKERDEPDACYVGRILSVEGGIVWMREIGPDATWDADPLAHKIGHITRVNFGGGYEDALALVGGAPPAPVGPARVPLRLVSSDG